MKSWQREDIDIIHRVMVDYWGGEFIGRGRKREAAEQRMMFCRHAYNLISGITLSDIAQYIGRTHAAVIHSINRAGELCDIDQQYRHDYEVTTALIKDGFEKSTLGMLAQDSYDV